VLDRSFLMKVGQATAIVTEMAVTVVAGVYLGSYLDSRFGLSPALLLTLTLGALIIGMVRLTRSVEKLTATNDPHPPKHHD
jgi:F0F1-type ATP synthase assembly protein I